MTDSNGNLVMPVAPMGGGYGGGDGFLGGNSGWWIILFLIVLMGGWGNGFGGNGGGFAPFAYTNNDVQRGFDQSAIVTGINGIQTSLCNGFAGVNSNLTNGFAQAEIAANSRQMADMNQNFALQTALLGGFNGVQSQLAQCCCDNRLATANLTSTVLAENCADRAALSEGIQAILVNQNNGIEKILNQMCSDKIDQKNEKIVELNNRINFLESNNYLQNALTAQTQYFVERYPVPTTSATNG